jgi:hypothetical protein
MGKLSRDLVAEKNEDIFLDNIFVKFLAKEICDLDPDIGAFIFPSTKIIIFMRDGLIIYKVRLNEMNVSEMTPLQHKVEALKILGYLDSGLIPQKDLNNLRKAASGLKLKLAKSIKQ